jgi:hypothetical protein
MRIHLVRNSTSARFKKKSQNIHFVRIYSTTLQIWDTTKKCTQYSEITVIKFTVFNCLHCNLTAYICSVVRILPIIHLVLIFALSE